MPKEDKVAAVAREDAVSAERGGAGAGAGEEAMAGVGVDRNKLEAQLMRAEMRGDADKVASIKV